MESKEFFEKLLKAPSPSGYEEEATKVFNDYCSKFSNCNHEFEDSIGNSVFSIGTGEKKILISGHIDTPLGLQVQYINDSGLIHFITLGGVDRKVLPGSRVKILTENGKIPGIISKKAIHVESDDEYDSVLKIKELSIDIGAEDKKEAEELVNVGDPVIILPEPIMEFGKNRIVSGGLDDKVSVYIVAEVLRKISEAKYVNLAGKKLYFAAVTQEEVGLRGSKVLANRLDLDASIDLDVTFATDTYGIEKEVYGDIALGKGPVIEHGPDCNKNLIRLAKSIANKEKILVQFGSHKPGGTNTDSFQMHGSNCATMLLSIPQRGMHVGNSEMCDWRDINSAIDLVMRILVNI